MAGLAPDPNSVPGVLSTPRESHITPATQVPLLQKGVHVSECIQHWILDRKQWKWWLLSHLGESCPSHGSFS